MKRPHRHEHGSTLMEFVLVGIPLMFVLISIFEIARGMWTYQTLGYSVKRGGRYAIVHGSNCALSGNPCNVTIGQIASVMKNAGLGLDGNLFSLTFTPSSGSAVSCALNDCLTNTTVWPPSTANTPGSAITISATYPFVSAISMFWPGAGGGMQFAAVNLGATSNDLMQF